MGQDILSWWRQESEDITLDRYFQGLHSFLATRLFLVGFFSSISSLELWLRRGLSGLVTFSCVEAEYRAIARLQLRFFGLDGYLLMLEFLCLHKILCIVTNTLLFRWRIYHFPWVHETHWNWLSFYASPSWALWVGTISLPFLPLQLIDFFRKPHTVAYFSFTYQTLDAYCCHILSLNKGSDMLVWCAYVWL